MQTVLGHGQAASSFCRGELRDIFCNNSTFSINKVGILNRAGLQRGAASRYLPTKSGKRLNHSTIFQWVLRAHTFSPDFSSLLPPRALAVRRRKHSFTSRELVPATMNRSPAETASLGRVGGRCSERFQLDIRAISAEAEAEAETPLTLSKNKEGGQTQNNDAAAGARVRMRVERAIVRL